MPHYFLEGFENDWRLVRETPHSQRFMVTTDEGKRASVDVHYTPSKILTVSICCIGQEEEWSKAQLTPIMNELSKIALRRSDYAVIDYSLSYAARIVDGNFSVDQQTREIFKETL